MELSIIVEIEGFGRSGFTILKEVSVKGKESETETETLVSTERNTVEQRETQTERIDVGEGGKPDTREIFMQGKGVGVPHENTHRVDNNREQTFPEQAQHQPRNTNHPRSSSSRGHDTLSTNRPTRLFAANDIAAIPLDVQQTAMSSVCARAEVESVQWSSPIMTLQQPTQQVFCCPAESPSCESRSC